VLYSHHHRGRGGVQYHEYAHHGHDAEDARDRHHEGARRDLGANHRRLSVGWHAGRSDRHRVRVGPGDVAAALPQRAQELPSRTSSAMRTTLSTYLCAAASALPLTFAALAADAPQGKDQAADTSASVAAASPTVAERDGIVRHAGIVFFSKGGNRQRVTDEL